MYDKIVIFHHKYKHPLHPSREDEVMALVRGAVPGAVEEYLSKRGGAPTLLDIAGVAALLGVSKRTAETLLADGTLPPPLRIGRQRRWDRAAIEAHVRRCASGGGRRR